MRSATAASSSASGTTRLTSPQSSAVAASMTSPVSASSMARLRPMSRAMATIGVWQNHPPLPPGAAKPADSAATARSHEATSWQPAAVARACTRASTTCGTSWMVCISSVHSASRLRTSVTGRSWTSRKSCPALKTGPSPASTTPVASLPPASVKAASSCARCSRESALRRGPRVIVIQIVSPSRSIRGAPSSFMGGLHHRTATPATSRVPAQDMIAHRPDDAGSEREMEPVRFGLVGYGFGGRYFHAPLLAAAPECALLGVVTTSPERRGLVRREHPDVTTFASLEDLRAAGAEAVALPPPADPHPALTDRALDLGLAVVCDKPFALDADAALSSVERAERLGLPLSPYQNRRWDSDFLTVRGLVDSGRLGTVTRFESRFERFSPEPGPPAAGGGRLRDSRSPLVAQAILLLGPVANVFAETHVNAHGLDDDFFVALTHVNGAHSQLWGSWIQGAPGDRFRVAGAEGAYVVGGPMEGQEAALLAGRTPATEGANWGAEPESRWGRFSRGDEVEVVPTERGRWDTFYPAFAAAVRREGGVTLAARVAVETARVLEVARLCPVGGGAIPLPFSASRGRA